MLKALEQVTEFHRAFGHPVALDKFLAATPDEHTMAVARQSWIAEEETEIQQAFEANSLKDLADGLVDLRYFILGSAVAYGTPLDAGEAQSAAKHALAAVVNAMYWAYVKTPHDNEHVRREAIVHAEIVIQGVAALYGIPLEAVFKYVHEKGNMSKLGPDGKPTLNPETGKVIKPSSWTPPDIGLLVGYEGIEPGVPVSVRLMPQWMPIDDFARSGTDVVLKIAINRDAPKEPQHFADVASYDSVNRVWFAIEETWPESDALAYYPLPE